MFSCIMQVMLTDAGGCPVDTLVAGSHYFASVVLEVSVASRSSPGYRVRGFEQQRASD
jgi:hypothetical protein